MPTWDLTQQTFLYWTNKHRNIRNPKATKSWLYTTLYREFLKIAKKRTRYSSFVEEEDEPEPITPSQIQQVRQVLRGS